LKHRRRKPPKSPPASHIQLPAELLDKIIPPLNDLTNALSEDDVQAFFHKALGTTRYRSFLKMLLTLHGQFPPYWPLWADERKAASHRPPRKEPA